ncbi:MAG: hypothetical protein ABFD50_22275 [Smithella sp.]
MPPLVAVTQSSFSRRLHLRLNPGGSAVFPQPVINLRADIFRFFRRETPPFQFIQFVKCIPLSHDMRKGKGKKKTGSTLLVFRIDPVKHIFYGKKPATTVFFRQ